MPHGWMPSTKSFSACLPSTITMPAWMSTCWAATQTCRRARRRWHSAATTTWSATMRCGHASACLCDPRSNPARRHSRQAMPRHGRYAGSAPEWKPRMPRLSIALALHLALMLLGATPAMAMAADPQVSTEVFVERGDNSTFELQQVPAVVYSTAPATPPDTLLQVPMEVLLVAQL